MRISILTTSIIIIKTSLVDALVVHADHEGRRGSDPENVPVGDAITIAYIIITISGTTIPIVTSITIITMIMITVMITISIILRISVYSSMVYSIIFMIVVYISSRLPLLYYEYYYYHY